MRYPEGVYTLGGVRFSNADVVVWTPTGDIHRLKSGKKWDPHFTYHGAGESSHSVSYGRYYHERVRQPLEATFSGFEPLLVQGFGREYARSWGRPCKGFDRCLTIESSAISEKIDVIEDHLGEVKTSLPTAYFAVDLVEAHRIGLAKAEAGKVHASIIMQDLIKDTIPWCLVTIGHSIPQD